MRNYIKTGIAINVGLLLLGACKNAPKEADNADATINVRTPVTITNIFKESISDYVELNATSTFLVKSYLSANATGYITRLYVQPGQYVKEGDILAVLKTKEAETIGNTLSKLDTSLKFTGLTTIRCKIPGYVTLLKHQTGDYVQDGEPLAVISDANSFAFMLELPYELKPYLPINNSIELQLPDGSTLKGTVATAMPTVDAASQTQSIIIKAHAPVLIPEGLIAKVRLVKTTHTGATVVPKSAVLTNETQTDFWIMKLTDSTTAVKIPIHKGIETKEKVEIISPILSIIDKILVTGNFGLNDTAKVIIQH